MLQKFSQPNFKILSGDGIQELEETPQNSSNQPKTQGNRSREKTKNDDSRFTEGISVFKPIMNNTAPLKSSSDWSTETGSDDWATETTEDTSNNGWGTESSRNEQNSSSSRNRKSSNERGKQEQSWTTEDDSRDKELSTERRDERNDRKPPSDPRKEWSTERRDERDRRDERHEGRDVRSTERRSLDRKGGWSTERKDERNDRKPPPDPRNEWQTERRDERNDRDRRIPSDPRNERNSWSTERREGRNDRRPDSRNEWQTETNDGRNGWSTDSRNRDSDWTNNSFPPERRNDGWSTSDRRDPRGSIENDYDRRSYEQHPPVRDMSRGSNGPPPRSSLSSSGAYSPIRRDPRFSDSREMSPTRKRPRSPSFSSPDPKRHKGSGESVLEDIQRELKQIRSQLIVGGSANTQTTESIDKELHQELVSLIKTNIKMVNQLSVLTNHYREQVQKQAKSANILLEKLENRFRD